MPKPRIQFPDRFHFETNLPIYITDINYGGHLSHDKVLSLAFEARCRFYRHFGFEELDIGGVGTIMSYANIRFLAEAKYGDEVKVEIAVSDMSAMQFTLVYALTEIKSEKVIAHVETGIVAYDYSKKSVAAIPERFKTTFT